MLENLDVKPWGRKGVPWSSIPCTGPWRHTVALNGKSLYYLSNINFIYKQYKSSLPKKIYLGKNILSIINKLIKSYSLL